MGGPDYTIKGADDYTIWTMTVTPFQEDGSLDEQALRELLRRLVAARAGIYLTCAGAGEAATLTLEEHRRIYDIGVEEAKGKVPVVANVRPSPTSEDAYEICKEAIAAGVDEISIYQMLPQLGMVPNDRESEKWWSDLLDRVNYPVAIAFNPQVGYSQKQSLILKLCEKYEQIVQVNTPPQQLAGSINQSAPRYETFTTLRDALPPRVKVAGSLNAFPSHIALGCSGAQLVEPCVIPNICNGVLDSYREGDIPRSREYSQTFQRFTEFCRQWHPATARWTKMAMKVLGLGNGVLRPPYLLPGEDDQRRMAEAFTRMGVRELEARALPALRT